VSANREWAETPLPICDVSPLCSKDPAKHYLKFSDHHFGNSADGVAEDSDNATGIAVSEVAVERPAYDLTIFKLHCGKLTLKIYTKGERVLRIEVVDHNTKQLRCGRSLEKFPEIVAQAKSILKRFMNALSCIDQCFIAGRMLAQLPVPSQAGKTKVGGIDLNKARMRWVSKPSSPGRHLRTD